MHFVWSITMPQRCGLDSPDSEAEARLTSRRPTVAETPAASALRKLRLPTIASLIVGLSFDFIPLLAQPPIPALEPWSQDHAARHADQTRQRRETNRADRAGLRLYREGLNRGHGVSRLRRWLVRVYGDRVVHLVGVADVARR